MNATIRQTAQYSREHAIKVVANQGKIVVLARTRDGVQISDARNLGERLRKPIKGRGIVFCFGETHFIVTEKKLSKMEADSFPIKDAP